MHINIWPKYCCASHSLWAKYCCASHSLTLVQILLCITLTLGQILLCITLTLGQILLCITLTHKVSIEHQNFGSRLYHKQEMLGDIFLHSYISCFIISIMFYLNIIVVITYSNLQLYEAIMYVFIIYLYIICSLFLYNVITP